MTPQPVDNELNGLTIIVIGAGPAGLTFAKSAALHGATVTILEQAGDPRGGDAGYTNRSFNLTLNQVGRRVLGDERAWLDGTDVVGRAVHNFQGTGTTKHSDFTHGDDTLLVSVPRPVLRQNLVKMAEEKGVKIHFNCNVTSLDTDKGIVTFTKETEERLSADLVVVADGVHSIADGIIKNKLKSSIHFRDEALRYITVLLDKETCSGLSLHHMHFWHEPQSSSVAIGMPNKDGTVAVLLISKFDDVSEQISPFDTLEHSLERLQRDFPQLMAIDPNLPHRVLGRERGYFHYKFIDDYAVGKRAVVIGDASSACPPWAGFGANTAMYSADVLVRFLIAMNNDIDEALARFQDYNRLLSERVLDYANQHGKFLNGRVADHPEERPIGPVLGQIINEVNAKADLPVGVELLTFKNNNILSEEL